jgi:crotonobetainyl-CoA:carnitine CoA-transferase CaiB-like acyl-CoA transferase
MSGLAHMTGFPEGPPTFPSTTLADGVASLWAVIGTLASLFGNGSKPEGVEVVDVSLVEGLLRIIPTQIATYQQLGVVQTRPGNYIGERGALRNCYRTQDGKWYIVAATGNTIRDIMVGVGAQELVAEFDTGIVHGDDTKAIAAFVKRCDDFITGWSAVHDFAQVTAELSAADAVHAPVYSAAEIMEDPHLKAREQLVTLPDQDLGEVTMQGIVPRFPGRDHKIRHAGRAKGFDNEAFYLSRGFTQADLESMRQQGLI